MEEFVIDAMNVAADEILAAGHNKAQAIEDMRIWLDNWEESDDD